MVILIIMGLMACENPASLTPPEALSNDANLTSILVTAQNQIRPLIPEFTPEVLEYRVQVPPETSSLLFTGTLSHEFASLSIANIQGTAADGVTSLSIAAVPTGIQVSQLQTGENSLQARVVAQDTSVYQTYHLTIEVAPIPLTLTWTDSQTPITEEDTTNGRTIGFSINNVHFPTADITITIPLTYRDTGNQIGAGNAASITFSSSSPSPSITLTGRSTDDGNTDNERVSISFGTPSITGTHAADYVFNPITRGISFTVLDDDIPAIRARLSSVDITEGGTATLTLTLQNPSTSDVTVTPSGAGLTFAPTSLTLSSTTTTGTITVTVTDNTTPSGDRGIALNMAANPSGVPILPSPIRITVRDNDLAIPRRLTATAGDARVILSWQAVEDATSYQLYRASGGNSPALITTTPATITETRYEDIGLTNGTEYTYTVQAVSSNKRSADSTSASATPADHGFSIASATPLSVDGGRIGGWLGEWYAVDTFSIRLEAGELFTAWTESDLNTKALIRNGNSDTILEERGPVIPVGAKDFIFTFVAPTTATYYLDVGTDPSSPLGNYYLYHTVGDDDGHGSTRSTATAITSGQSLDGTIATGTDEDFFRIEARAGQTITAHTTGLLNTFGVLQDSSGTELATHDDISVLTNLNFRISHSVSQTGTYYILVKGVESRSHLRTGTGHYTLTVRVSGS